MADKGEAEVMTMTEFGQWYRKKFPINHREVSLAKEVLYGSGKHYFWYIDPYMRVLVDMFQGCSIGDLRPYIAKVPVTTGSDTPHKMLGSYPYLIHSQYRTGFLNHCFDGSRTTAILKHGESQVDLADFIFKCDEVFDDRKGFVTKPSVVKFDDGVEVTLKIRFLFEEDGQVIIERELVSVEGGDKKQIELTEYFKGCYGITEYPEDMSDITLTINAAEAKSLPFRYKRQQLSSISVDSVEVIIPPIKTIAGLKPADGKKWDGTVAEGILFSPYYTLKLTRVLKAGEASRICLYLKAMN